MLIVRQTAEEGVCVPVVESYAASVARLEVGRVEWPPNHVPLAEELRLGGWVGPVSKLNHG
jgi:hypothetical protein